MFPDSDIAKGYCQGKTKVKYVIQYGIANYIKDILKKGFIDTPFTFKFDETTFAFKFDKHDIFVTLSTVTCLSVSHVNTQWWKEPRRQLHNQGQ